MTMHNQISHTSAPHSLISLHGCDGGPHTHTSETDARLRNLVFNESRPRELRGLRQIPPVCPCICATTAKRIITGLLHTKGACAHAYAGMGVCRHAHVQAGRMRGEQFKDKSCNHLLRREGSERHRSSTSWAHNQH
jgi:hypothetical protein